MLITGKKSGFERFTNCLSANKVAIKEKLTKALETINNSKAQEALKNYHVAVMSALSSIIAGSDELNYEQRQQALEDKVTEAWERFEIERDYQTERERQPSTKTRDAVHIFKMN